MAELFKATATMAESWDNVFSRPGPVTVDSMVTGMLKIRAVNLFNLKHPAAHGIDPEETYDLPILAHLIRHEMLGYFLIDTGLNSSYQTNPRGRIKGLLKNVGRYTQAPGQDTLSQLKAKNVQLNGVLFTHLHLDHTAGASELPRHLPYYACRGERENMWPMAYADHLKGISVKRFDFSGARQMPIIGPCLDVFGDGSLWAISTPGHTPGHTSYIVNGKTPALVTGDACISKRNMELGVASNIRMTDVRHAQSSIEKLAAFSRAYPQAKVVCGHQLPLADRVT